MKSFRIVLVLEFSTIILFGVLYPLAIVGIGKLVPSQANGLPILKDGNLVGFENVGQPFNSGEYFWGRPSAVSYNAAATGGSNKGPTNSDFLSLVQSRIDTLLKYHPEVAISDIPVDLVTASGSGLDPHISKKGALIQVSRVARARGLETEALNSLIDAHTEKPLLGLFGPSDQVNVLELNRALDELDKPK